MSIPTSDVRAPGHRLVWTAGLSMLFLGSSLLGCEDDVGRCCTVIDPSAEGRIPVALSTDERATSDIAIDPAFDCESLVCVAYLGRPAFCTAFCTSEGDCPEGFVCRQVLEAGSLPPDANREINPEDRFCVRADFQCRQ